MRKSKFELSEMSDLPEHAVEETPSVRVDLVQTPARTSTASFPMLNSPQRAQGMRKTPLAPGHSPMDWAKLSSSKTDLAGVSEIKRFTPADLAAHSSQQDAYISLRGKVYNMTHYIPYHPGGKFQLMRGAGKDATELFNKTHSWVNADKMLENCLVGYLIPGNST